MSWICFHIENERLLKAAVSEEIRVECDKLFRQRGYEERGRWIPEKEVILSYIVEPLYAMPKNFSVYIEWIFI